LRPQNMAAAVAVISMYLRNTGRFQKLLAQLKRRQRLIASLVSGAMYSNIIGVACDDEVTNLIVFGFPGRIFTAVDQRVSTAH